MSFDSVWKDGADAYAHVCEGGMWMRIDTNDPCALSVNGEVMLAENKKAWVRWDLEKRGEDLE